MAFRPRSIPFAVRQLYEKVDAPQRLVAHLTLVHDAAVEVVQGLRHQFPTLVFDDDAVLFGAASHDLGKTLHPSEITGPGNRHEGDGARLLEEHGIPPYLARFARTHGAWSRESLPLEDLLVALADCVWKGQRLDDLESLVFTKIAGEIGVELWIVFDRVDGLLQDVAKLCDERLAWQQVGVSTSESDGA